MKRLLSAVLCLVVASTVGAQSLRGSRASVNRMYTRAVANDLEFYRTSKGVYQSVRDGELVMIGVTMDMVLEDVAYPFVLPRTRDVVTVFARNYRQACGERLVVTSAARPRTEQPRNASPKSVHPTGMAIDFRRPAGNCLTFMRQQLVQLERQGILEATEERRPVHFHVAVLQRGRFAPVARAAASAAAVPIDPSPTDSGAGSRSMDLRVTGVRHYAVRKGDTLSGIARRFGLTVGHLKSLNGLEGSAIKPGQKLRVM